MQMQGSPVAAENRLVETANGAPLLQRAVALEVMNASGEEYTRSQRVRHP